MTDGTAAPPAEPRRTVAPFAEPQRTAPSTDERVVLGPLETSEFPSRRTPQGRAARVSRLIDSRLSSVLPALGRRGFSAHGGPPETRRLRRRCVRRATRTRRTRPTRSRSGRAKRPRRRRLSARGRSGSTARKNRCARCKTRGARAQPCGSHRIDSRGVVCSHHRVVLASRSLARTRSATNPDRAAFCSFVRSSIRSFTPPLPRPPSPALHRPVRPCPRVRAAQPRVHGVGDARDGAREPARRREDVLPLVALLLDSRRRGRRPARGGRRAAAARALRLRPRAVRAAHLEARTRREGRKTTTPAAPRCRRAETPPCETEPRRGPRRRRWWCGDDDDGDGRRRRPRRR